MDQLVELLRISCFGCCGLMALFMILLALPRPGSTQQRRLTMDQAIAAALTRNAALGQKALDSRLDKERPGTREHLAWRNAEQVVHGTDLREVLLLARV